MSQHYKSHSHVISCFYLLTIYYSVESVLLLFFIFFFFILCRQARWWTLCEYLHCFHLRNCFIFFLFSFSFASFHLLCSILFINIESLFCRYRFIFFLFSARYSFRWLFVIKIVVACWWFQPFGTICAKNIVYTFYTITRRTQSEWMEGAVKWSASSERQKMLKCTETTFWIM